MAHGADSLGSGPARVILAIETSCDDTCAALVTWDGEIRASVISSQGVHDRYGGVVPEIASRHHLELIGHVVDNALESVLAPEVDARRRHVVEQESHWTSGDHAGWSKNRARRPLGSDFSSQRT